MVRGAGATVVYCRVGSHDQKADLERQAGRVLTMCSELGIRIDRTVTEIGSGPNGRRTELRKLLGDPTVITIVVEHRDRLARFGVEYLEAALAAHGRTVVVLDETELADELARDLTEVLTSPVRPPVRTPLCRAQGGICGCGHGERTRPSAG